VRGETVGRERLSDPVELSVTRAARLYGRALLLRCPHCGGGPVVASWFRMHARCGRCGIRTERGEEDFFLGSMMFNIILSEGLFVVLLLTLLLVRWPEVPWDFLQTWAIVLMAVAPFLVFPWTKTLWLASDILIRPVTDEEMAWHRENDASAIRSYVDR
jgi:uncharacterized protein (DUF983 family)